MPNKRAARSRVSLDRRFEQMRPAAQFAPPVRGWIQAIRNGLGMTSAQLASRLGVKQPSVTALEKSEARGTVELGTLRRAAEALNCTVVYALIPRKPPGLDGSGPGAFRGAGAAIARRAFHAAGKPESK